MNLSEAIANIAQPIVADKGLTLAGIRLSTEKGVIVQVLLENKDGTGANLAACEAVSRELGYALEVEDAVNQKYTLEVSSPGLNRPLFTLADVKRFYGKNAKIKLFTEVDNKKVHVGILGPVDGNMFSLTSTQNEANTEKTVQIDWSDIKEAKLSPTDQEIQQLLKDKKSA